MKFIISLVVVLALAQVIVCEERENELVRRGGLLGILGPILQLLSGVLGSLTGGGSGGGLLGSLTGGTGGTGLLGSLG
ncbi:hypothetical protein CHUAL_008256 [Chamberlinius hualienensis]